MMPFNLANAAGLAGWTLGGGIAHGASTVYNGTKNVLINGKNVVQKGVATVTPTATGVAKVLARGVAGVALSVAVEQLLGSVDWVLDPANNQIKYYVDPQDVSPTYQYGYQFGQKVYPSIKSAAEAYFLTVPSLKGKAVLLSTTTGKDINNRPTGIATYAPDPKVLTDKRTVTFSYVANPLYDPKAEREEKTIPLETVAQKVISNAEGGDVAAQEATIAAAADIVAEAEKDSTKARPIVTQLESSAETATDETATGESTKPDTADPTAPPDVTSISLKFPVFCGWAPTVCQAAQVVISFPNTLTDWWETANSKADGWANSISQAWTAAKDWFTSENHSETNLDIDTSQDIQPNSTINFSTQCPSKIPLVFPWNGGTLDFSFDFTIWCNAISTFVYPIVVTLGSLHALYIVTGVRQNG